MNILPRLPRVPRFLLAALALAAAPALAQGPAMKSADRLALEFERKAVIPAVAYEKTAVTNVLADIEAKANRAIQSGTFRLRIRLDETVTNELPAVTLRANSIGLGPLLSMLADMTGLEHRIQEGQVVFGLPSAPSADDDAWPAPAAPAPAAPSAQPAPSAAARALLEDPNLIIHRQYPIRGANADAAKLKAWFAGKGVAWPEGSNLTLPVPGILTVANTRENLDRIEYILRQLPSQQPRP